MKRNYGFLFLIISFLLVGFAGTAPAQEELTPDEKKALLSILILHKEEKPLTKAQEAVYRVYMLYHFDKSEATLKALKARLADLKPKGPSPTSSQTRGISPKLRRAISLYTGTSGPVDEESAKLLFIEATESGDPLAVMWLARLYYMGRCMFARDEQKGLELAKKAIEGVKRLAKEGNPDAMFLLGSCYSSGLAVAQDKEKALYWYRKAAKRGHAPAMGNLGYLLKNDPFKDLDKAFYWTKKAADKGVVYAIFNLGALYHDGLGVTQDYDKAFYYFKKAADQGVPLAYYNLGYCYERGKGVKRDKAKAIYWYEKAAEAGYEPAKERLQELRPGQAGSSGGGGGGMPLCFVVPSVCGTPQEYYVPILRLFRDKVLRQSLFGEKIIKAYYAISPYIASYIKDKPIARAMVRYALAPVVFVAGAFLGKGWNMVVIGIIAALMVFVPLLMFRKHRDQIRYQS